MPNYGGDESHDGLLPGASGAWIEDHSQRQFRYTRAIIIPWVLSLFFFCTTCLFAWQSRATPVIEVPSDGTYEAGFTTDFVSASPQIDIRIVQKQFTNNLYFNATSQSLYNQQLDPEETTYVGRPNPDLDAAWHDLLHDQYVALSHEETQQFPEQDRALITYDKSQHYYFELSVFHNLHCLNEIRKMVDHDYYELVSPHLGNDIFADREHMDHCIDQIRQALQCHADLTPVPLLPIAGGPGGAFIGNGEVHTCRDFDHVREWVKERGLQTKALGD